MENEIHGGEIPPSLRIHVEMESRERKLRLDLNNPGGMKIPAEDKPTVFPNPAGFRGGFVGNPGGFCEIQLELRDYSWEFRNHL